MSQQKPKILIVDDKSTNLYTMEKLLQKLDVQVILSTSAIEALEIVLDHDFCLAIVDVQMPEMDGYEFVELLRGNTSTASLPVIFVSAIYSDEYHHRKGYDAGAVDFLSKPFVPEILLSKVRVFLDLYNQRKKLQDLVKQLNEVNTILSQRAIQLETISQVGRQVTSILNLDELLSQVTDLIQTKFNYYFVGAWLVNEPEDTLLLRASSWSQSDQSFDPHFAVPLSATRSIIVHVHRTAQAYLSNDVRTDDRYMEAKDLPDTCSELALPLRFGQRVLGVMDIQSKYVGAFDPKDVTLLQPLADQIAISIRNAQLYSKIVLFNEELEAKVRERTAELAKAYQHLELLDHNKSDFVQVVSHELRTPLTLIKGYSQMLLSASQAEEDETYHQKISGIVTGVTRMEEIVNSMLEVVRIDTRALRLSPTQISIPQLLETLREKLAQDLEERSLTLLFEDMPGMPKIEADPDALNTLFEHLLVNAIKYTPDGGRITVSGRVLPERTGDFPNGAVEILISDTGIGIAPESQELIFDKFYQAGDTSLHSTGRTKFKGGGPGLGLTIARGIIEAHGGRIWVESPGYDEQSCPGSEFHVILPVTQTVASLPDQRLAQEPV